MDPLANASAAASFSAVGPLSGSHGFPPAASASFSISTSQTSGLNAGPFSSTGML